MAVRRGAEWGGTHQRLGQRRHGPDPFDQGLGVNQYLRQKQKSVCPFLASTELLAQL